MDCAGRAPIEGHAAPATSHSPACWRSCTVATLPDLNAAHPLPKAPWFEPGARWSARRALMHIIAETAQHAGHADIIRESLDGATSMG